jgi:cation diffusion facilitator family transporter
MQDLTADHDPSHKNIRLAAILIALFSGIGILVLKFYAAHIANSSALRSDALEGTVNVLAAAFGLGAIIFAEKPADHDHPYGHGKIEYFSSAFEGGLISLAGLLILIDSISRYLNHAVIHDLGMGLKISVLSGILNGVLGAGIYFTGKKYQSQTLLADGIHLLTDLVTSIILTAGLCLVLLTHWEWLDALLAIGVSLFLFRTGFMLVRESSMALLDAENPELLQTIVNHLNQNERGQVITVHELKAQQFGRDKHIDMHVVVPEYFSIKEAHELTDLYSLTLQKQLGHGSLVHTHIDPCEQDYCQECPVADCKIRKQKFSKRIPFTLESITRPGAR